MRVGFLVFGVLFLAVGGILHFLPNQIASASVTTPGSTVAHTASASIDASWGVTLGLLIVGAVFLVLGFALPTSLSPRSEHAVNYDSTTRETTRSANGRKVHTTYEKHVTEKKIR